ncbi:MAG TPA: RICIN domain-containing protein [Catenuloplanes sp.]
MRALSNPHSTARALAISHVINDNSGQCLALPGGSKVAGERTIQWPCGTWNDHYWTLRIAPNATFQIVNHNSGQCLALPGGSKVAGERPIQWPCGTWADHYWR